MEGLGGEGYGEISEIEVKGVLGFTKDTFLRKFTRWSGINGGNKLLT